MKKLNRQAPAYITLISVIITGAVILAIIIFFLESGTGATKNSQDKLQASQARALANACAEEALQAIRDDINFTGSGSLNLGSLTCNYLVTNSGGSNRTINASSTVGSNVQKARVVISTTSPKILVTSWDEVGD
ncbi:MAG: hypothetical protein WC441_02085 [Patescibacteria group bacterium]